MKKNIKRFFATLMTLTMALSILLPFTAFANVGNEKTVGSLTIEKYEIPPLDRRNPLPMADFSGEEQLDPDNDWAIPDDAKPVEGVTYYVKQIESFDGTNWNDITNGAEYTETTGADGVIIIENMPLGRYEVTETNAPDHVIANTNTFTVDIPMSYNYGEDLAYDITIYPKNETVIGDIELEKVDADGNPLADVVFGLYRNGDLVSELITNEYGIVSIENIDAGKYYLKEFATADGYAVNNSEIHFTVQKTGDGESGTTESVWTHIERFTKGLVGSGDNGNGYNNLEGVQVTNYLKPTIDMNVEGKMLHSVDRNVAYDYNIIINTPKNITEYTELKVLDTLDNRLEYNGNWEVAGTTKDNIVFTQSEQELSWLFSNPENLVDGEPIVITVSSKIKPDANVLGSEIGIPNNATLQFDNGRGEKTNPETEPITDDVHVVPNDGGLDIIKQDKETSEYLPYAEFKLTHDKEGLDVVQTEGTTILVNGESYDGGLEVLTTDEAGYIGISGLTPKVYYLHETRAPDYYDEDKDAWVSYRKLTKPIEVEVTNSPESNEITVLNAKSGFDLPATGGLGIFVGLAVASGLIVVGYNKSKEENKENENN